ncbi:ABC transporter permease [Filomicrobium sp.]|uniref:ABC transporter permease n=1 Tax=Filomicrobium sp. TaxID=2024831 RepID=UPI00258D9BD7|nr:ABC transporter permease [Filomicrobium sp.]MCV0370767.1 ABC transporter permease [Filomicrobium sp.]
MTSVWLALSYLRARPLLNGLTALAVALGISIVVATTTLSKAARQSASETAGGYQLLLAAKGSQIQAVLSTLFFAEAPTGNIPIEIYEQVHADQGVTLAVPFNFGDSFKSHLIVGTTPDYLHLIRRNRRSSQQTLLKGRWPEHAFEASLGAAVARATGLTIGDTFTAAHGFVELPEDLSDHHKAQPYTVVGLLEETRAPTDRAIFTTLDTSWRIHGQFHDASSDAHDHEGRQITAVLIEGRGYADVARLNALMAQRMDVQPIFPGRTATQVLGYLQRGQSLVTSIAWLAALIACLGIMISLFAAAVERRRQIATLRAIGASRATVLGVMAIEGLFIAGLGAVIGVAFGRLMAVAIAWQLEQSNGYLLTIGQAGLAEITAIAVAMALGLLAGFIPALLALREDVAKGLAAMT